MHRKSTDALRNSPAVLIQKLRARFQPFMCQFCAVKGEKAQRSGTTCKISAVHSPGPKRTCCVRFKSSLLPSGSISSSPSCWILLKPVTRGHLSTSAFCVGSPGQPRQSNQPRPWASLQSRRQLRRQAVQRRHCFFLCLLVSNGNCTTKSQYVWNLAWGCFGYIEVFASALPDLNGDFTSTELKRRKGEEGGSAVSGSERGRGPAHYIIIWTGIKWEGYDSLGLVKLWLKFYIHSFQSSHVLHLSREFRLSDVHEVCF